MLSEYSHTLFPAQAPAALPYMGALYAHRGDANLDKAIAVQIRQLAVVEMEGPLKTTYSTTYTRSTLL
jgi:hypothetical protein